MSRESEIQVTASPSNYGGCSTVELFNGGPAFPQPCTEGGHAANSPYALAVGGMSLRDWFAGIVLPAVVANGARLSSGSPDQWAYDAYEIADAMLSEKFHQPKSGGECDDS